MSQPTDEQLAASLAIAKGDKQPAVAPIPVPTEPPAEPRLPAVSAPSPRPVKKLAAAPKGLADFFGLDDSR